MFKYILKPVQLGNVNTHLTVRIDVNTSQDNTEFQTISASSETCREVSYSNQPIRNPLDAHRMLLRYLDQVFYAAVIWVVTLNTAKDCIGNQTSTRDIDTQLLTFLWTTNIGILVPSLLG